MSERTIDLSTLSLEQLNQLRKETEDQLRMLSSDYQQLRAVQQKFGDSASALTAFPADGQGREVLVPVAPSLYVRGKIGSTQEVLVDIGTGFFVGKPIGDAASIMSRKSDEVKQNADALLKVIEDRQDNLESITAACKSRAAMAQRVQAGLGSSGSA